MTRLVVDTNLITLLRSSRSVHLTCSPAMGRTSVSPAQGANASSNSSNIAQRLACHTKITIAISEALYALCIADLYQCPENEDQTISTHYCSMRHPCVLAQHALHPILVNFRLVCKFWDRIIVHEVEDRFLQPQPEIEAVYYPYAWHINTKVRRAILHGQFRVFRTIDTEGGESYVPAVSRHSVPYNDRASVPRSLSSFMLANPACQMRYSTFLF